MRILVPDVHQLGGFAPHAINAYLVAGVLVDAGTPLARRRILRELQWHQVSAHVVTHGHPDHFGSSHAVCEALDLPLWTGERDAAAVETAPPVPAEGALPGLMMRMKMLPAHPVARRLREGDGWPASPCSTSPDTHPATSHSGGNRMACCSGVSGAGKSTIATVLAGILPTSGGRRRAG